MKILHYVAIMNRGGEETFIMNVMRKINLNYYHFDFLCSLEESGDYDEEIKKLGGKVLTYKASTIKSPLKQIDNLWRLCKMLRSLKGEYDVFHIHTQHAMDSCRDVIAAKIAGIPKIIVHSHSTNTTYHIKAHKIFRNLLNLFDINKLACSKEAGEWLFGKNAQFEIITNGIDTEKFMFSSISNEKIREKLGLDDSFVIGHVGNYTTPKNHKFIIDIFNEYLKLDNNAKLILVGNGYRQMYYEEYVKNLGIEEKVMFLGGRDDVNVLMNAFNIFVFPSLYEGLGIVLIEAQANGLRCIISNNIPNEVIITNNIVRMSLDKPAYEWANQIFDYKDEIIDRKYCNYVVNQSKFDINESVEKLAEIYKWNND